MIAPLGAKGCISRIYWRADRTKTNAHNCGCCIRLRLVVTPADALIALGLLAQEAVELPGVDEFDKDDGALHDWVLHVQAEHEPGDR